MKRVFNDGIGMILVVNRDAVVKIVEELTSLAESPIICGRIQVRLKDATDVALKED